MIPEAEVGEDKENTVKEVKFDRVKQKAPETMEFQPHMANPSWPSAFGSLPSCLINSSMEKESLR